MTETILPKSASVLQRQATTARVVRLLRDQILSGTLPEGLRLRQEKLAAELGVSRVPVREALRQLEAEGLVKQESHKGAIVSGLSIDDLEEVHEIHTRLEAWLLELSPPLITEQQQRSPGFRRIFGGTFQTANE